MFLLQGPTGWRFLVSKAPLHSRVADAPGPAEPLGIGGLGFRVWGLEFVVCGLWFGVWSLGFGVWG